MRKLLLALVLLVFGLTSNIGQNMVGQYSSDITEFYKNKGFVFMFSPFENKETGKEEVCLILKQNEFGGQENLYINENNRCYLHIYIYKTKQKYNQFISSCSKKGYKMTDDNLETILPKDDCRFYTLHRTTKT